MNQAQHWLAPPEEGDSLAQPGKQNTYKDVAFSVVWIKHNIGWLPLRKATRLLNLASKMHTRM